MEFKTLIKRCQMIINNSSYQVQNAKVIEEAKEYLEVVEDSNSMPHRVLDESVDVVLTAIEKMLLEGFKISDILNHLEYKLNRTYKELGITEEEIE
jgi:phosphoribosyl-ATP pyrophosphohydrolase